MHANGARAPPSEVLYRVATRHRTPGSKRTNPDAEFSKSAEATAHYVAPRAFVRYMIPASRRGHGRPHNRRPVSAKTKNRRSRRAPFKRGGAVSGADRADYSKRVLQPDTSFREPISARASSCRVRRRSLKRRCCIDRVSEFSAAPRLRTYKLLSVRSFVDTAAALTAVRGASFGPSTAAASNLASQSTSNSACFSANDSSERDSFEVGDARVDAAHLREDFSGGHDDFSPYDLIEGSLVEGVVGREVRLRLCSRTASAACAAPARSLIPDTELCGHRVLYPMP